MKRILTIAGIGATAALTLPVSAQTVDFENVNLSLRAGAFAPFDNDLKNLDDVWFQMGLDFEFEAALFRNATTVVSVDWLTRTSGARDNAFPMIVSQRWYSGDDDGPRFYWHVGIGATASDFRPADFLFTARAGVGMQVNSRIFFEANVMWSEEDKGQRAVTGVSGFVGVRF